MTNDDEPGIEEDIPIPTKREIVDIHLNMKVKNGTKVLLFSITPRKTLTIQPQTSDVIRVDLHDPAPPLLFRPYRRLFLEGKDIGQILYLFFKSGPIIAVLGALRVKNQPKGSSAPDVIFFPAWGCEQVKL